MIRHLGSSLTDVTYVFDEPTIGLHPHDIAADERPAAAAARQGQHRAGGGAQARGHRNRRPRRRSGSRRGYRRWRTGLRGHRRRPPQKRHGHRPPSRRPRDTQGRGADLDGGARGARRRHQQPAGRRRRHPARRAGRHHRRRRVGQELADRRLGGRTGRRGDDRPGADPRLAAQQPGDLHRAARPDPQGVREGQRGQARVVQRQLRRRMPQLQRRGRHLHGPGDHGRGGDAMRRVRGQALRRVGAGVHVRRPRHQRGAGDAGERGTGILRRRRRENACRTKDPRAARRRRAGLPHSRPAAHHPVRR